MAAMLMAVLGVILSVAAVMIGLYRWTRRANWQGRAG
jgi:hypothetical protein